MKRWMLVFIVGLLVSCKPIVHICIPFSEREEEHNDWASFPDDEKEPVRNRRDFGIDRQDIRNSVFCTQFDSASIRLEGDTNILLRFYASSPIDTIQYFTSRDTIHITTHRPFTEGPRKQATDCYKIPTIKNKEHFILRINNTYSIPIFKPQLKGRTYVYPLIKQSHQDGVKNEIIGAWESEKPIKKDSMQWHYNLNWGRLRSPHALVFHQDATYEHYINKELVYTGVYWICKPEGRYWTIHKDSTGKWEDPIWYFYDIRKDSTFRKEEYHDVSDESRFYRSPSIEMWPKESMFESPESTLLSNRDKNKIQINRLKFVYKKRFHGNKPNNNKIN